MTTESPSPTDDVPEEGKGAKVARGALQVASGVIPVVGGILSALAGAWSEREQAKVNKFFEQWVRMLEDPREGGDSDRDHVSPRSPRRQDRRSR